MTSDADYKKYVSAKYAARAAGGDYDEYLAKQAAEERTRYGITIRDGLTSRTRSAFNDQVNANIRAICGMEDVIPFLCREITMDADWYALMDREYAETPGYAGNGITAVALLRKAYALLGQARDILNPITLLEDGMVYSQHQRSGGLSGTYGAWTYGKGKRG